jgi:hypothetical protein
MRPKPHIVQNQKRGWYVWPNALLPDAILAMTAGHALRIHTLSKCNVSILDATHWIISRIAITPFRTAFHIIYVVRQAIHCLSRNPSSEPVDRTLIRPRYNDTEAKQD